VNRYLVIAAGLGLVVAAGADLWRLEGAGAKTGELVLYGNVDIRQVDLAFNAEGPLARLHKDEGDRVHAGDLLAEMVPDTYQHLESLAAARLAGEEAVLAKAIAGNRPEDIQEAEAVAAADQAVLANAEIGLKRATQLLSTGAGSRQAFDDAKTLADQVRARATASGKAAEIMRLGPRAEDIAAARAAVDADRAALALARQRLGNTRLTAPSDGVILTRIAEPGAVLGPTSPVYTLALTGQIWIRSFVPESSLGRIKPGDLVEVSTDSRPGRPYHGWIGYVAPTAEFTPKTVETPELRTQLVYRLRVFIKDPDDNLRQGMPVTLAVPTRTGAVAAAQ
jgi:HlyD family secretion protein